ncbi:MAG TPA: nucleotidyl transferase AbiEii/AbiGii toxin family protein [Thermoanaerobaculia bacterium]|jgi:hypothetical protein
MDLYEEFVAVIDLLDEHGIDYAICGGIAVALHGHPRFTKDIDLLVRRPDVDRIADALEARGFLFRAGRVPFDVGGPHERETFRISKIDGDGDTLTVDLLVVNDRIADVWETREAFAWQEREVTVVSAQGLAKMKRLAGRDQDLLDLKKLGLTEDE